MKIYAIDDHELFRTGLRHLLFGIDCDVEFKGFDSVEAAISSETSEPPELILLDYFMPGIHGDKALQDVGAHFPNSLVVVLSSLDDPPLIRDAIEHGAAGFIPKSSSQTVLINALRLILEGGIYLPRQVFVQGETSMSEREAALQDDHPVLDILHQLTDRQRDVVNRVVLGKSNKVIAYEMNISEGTVKSHLSTAYRVLGVSSRTQVVYLIANQSYTST